MPAEKPKVLTPCMYAIDVEPIPLRNRNNKEVHLDYLKHLKESVATLREIVEETMVEKPLDCSIASACLYTKHSQELLEYVIGTCLKDFNSRDRKIASTLLTRKNRVTFMETCCSKHMTRDRSRLRNFVKKFIETVRFRNDHFGAIMGYGDYVIGDSVISWVKFLRSKDDTLEFIIKFLKQIQVSLNKTVRYIRTDNVQVPVLLVGTPSSTIIDHDAPLTSYSLSSSIVQPPISHQGVADVPTLEDNPLAQANNDPFVNVFAPEPSSDDSSSGDGVEIQGEVRWEVLNCLEKNYYVLGEMRVDECCNNKNEGIKAFSALANVPSIYTQQLWNTLTYKAKTGVYRFQLDEQWFTLTSDLLRDALEITLVDPANPFVSTLAGEIVMDFMNELGYPKAVHFVSHMHVNTSAVESNFVFDQPEEFIQGIHTFFTHKIPSKKPTLHIIPYCRFTKLIIYYLGNKYDIHRRPESPRHVAGDDFLFGNLKFVLKGEKDEVFGMPIPKELIIEAIKLSEYYKAISCTAKQPKPKPVKEKSAKPTPLQKAGKGKVKNVQNVKSSLQLVDEPDEEQAHPKPESQGTPATEEASTRPYSQPQDDASANIVCDSSSPADAETYADTEKTNSGEEKTAKIDKGQAGSDLGKTAKSRPPLERIFMEEDQARPDPGLSYVALARPYPEPMYDDFIATMYPQVHESLKHPDKEHAQVENPLSSTGTLLSMKNLDAYTFGDQFFNDKPTKEEPNKANMETEVESMVTFLIHQASSSAHPLSTPVFDLSPPKHVPSTTQAPIFLATTITKTTTTFPPTLQLQSVSVPDLASHVSALEEVCDNFKKRHTHFRTTLFKEAVHVASQAPLRDRFRELLEAGMKEILHQRMFECGSYKSLPGHVALYEVHEASMELKDVPIVDDVNISDSEDTDTAHLPKIKTRPDWLKLVPEEDRLETSEPDWTIPPNDSPNADNNWADALAKSYKDLEENKLLSKTEDIGSFIKWFCIRIGKKNLIKSDLEGLAFKGHRLVPDVSKLLPLGGPPGQEFYITRHSAPFDRCVVRSHMWILSVISIKTFERYGYAYLRDIVIRRADYNEYKISEANFKNLHPNDFEDLYLLHLQGKLNHLPGSDKVHLYNAINMWIRNIVIRQRVGDLQLGIKSYQTKRNLTEPRWDDLDFLFKEDYTIVSKPRSVIYKDRYDQKKTLKVNKVHKFSNGTLTRICTSWII
nr:integrase, catalytic region, zinc finger, CCHC-type, peptidase aspartic, catalytic [Tanacetum cinerariifolium]